MRGQPVDERSVSRTGVLVLVGHHLTEARREPLSDVGAIAQQPSQRQHEVTRIEAPRVGEDAIVALIQVGELELAPRRLAIALARRFALPLGRPPPQ